MVVRAKGPRVDRPTVRARCHGRQASAVRVTETSSPPVTLPPTVVAMSPIGPSRHSRVASRMLFPTIQFGVFFPIVFVGSWLLRPHSRRWKLFMLVASYIFYGWRSE